jgi:predicted nucleic acid-binding Zn ribbon protein
MRACEVCGRALYGRSDRRFCSERYNVIVHNYAVHEGRQFELSLQWNPITLPGTVDVSVQACRKRTFRSSLCTPWSTFRVY